jgi:hypothetical protein
LWWADGKDTKLANSTEATKSKDCFELKGEASTIAFSEAMLALFVATTRGVLYALDVSATSWVPGWRTVHETPFFFPSCLRVTDAGFCVWLAVEQDQSWSAKSHILAKNTREPHGE